MAPPHATATADGYWGKITSTIDWCEENYVVTNYIAEFWNTISNIVMIVPPVFLAVLALKQKLEARLVMCNISLLIVGVGSWCFHMTLLYSMQLLDELPMIWGTSFLVYSFIACIEVLMMINVGNFDMDVEVDISDVEITSPPSYQNRWLQIFLAIYCLIVTAVYLLIKDPIFHEFAYGLLVVCLVAVSFRVIRQCEHNLALVVSGILIYLFGFILWNIDNNFCPQIRKVRKELGSLGPVSQLHAWWHLLAGIGTYLAIVFCIHTRYLYLKRDPKIKMFGGLWPYISFPILHNRLDNGYCSDKPKKIF